MFETIGARFTAQMPAVDFCSLRLSRERSQEIAVRQGVLQPLRNADDLGGMIVVHHNGGIGYAATGDLTASGLAAATRRAQEWAERSARIAVTDFSAVPMPHPKGIFRTPVSKPWSSAPLAESIAMLQQASTVLKSHARIVDWDASLWWTEAESLYVTSGGGEVHQVQQILVPHLSASANDGKDTVTRSLGGRGYARQAGMELLDEVQLQTQAATISKQALELLDAPDCPEMTGHLLLAPDQMMLQIHESIGHPLELDRILGDERNYAGTSFVSLPMFGSYQYGSELLNVTFDPTISNQLASFGWDDDGVEASKQYIIRDGLLERPLGSVISQHRAGMEGVANSRANGWNRPTIDRMANLNVEPGTSSFDDLVGSVENGVYMESNVSWSIDDSRNKFQFGCEYGRVIEDGQLKGVVRKPNYRGVSATFWRNLVGVGDTSTFDVLGTPYCGKGEPNQVIRVGHASPTCLFAGVEMFGGA
ncbi:MAG: TldD/PmbA family protein [Deltaproteobacteria bacterium]|nr:TldD/PmbA family protein [Deltaproteobacteria bacterium]